VSLDARVRELRKRLKEALEFIKRRDAVQASEKLYKAAESAVKSYLRLISCQNMR